MKRCKRCNGSIMKDGEEFICLNCGYILPDKIANDFVFDELNKRYKERDQKELVSKALMRHPE